MMRMAVWLLPFKQHSAHCESYSSKGLKLKGGGYENTKSISVLQETTNGCTHKICYDTGHVRQQCDSKDHSILHYWDQK